MSALTPAQRAEVAEMIEARFTVERRLREIPSGPVNFIRTHPVYPRLSCLPPQQDNGRVV